MLADKIHANFRPTDLRGLVDHVVLLTAIALIYVGLAKLSLALASIHPSATPIWPPTGYARCPCRQARSRFDGTSRPMKRTIHFCGSFGRKLAGRVLKSLGDRGLVTSSSPRWCRYRCEARPRSSSSPKESSGYFWPRPLVFSLNYHPAGPRVVPKSHEFDAEKPTRQRGTSEVVTRLSDDPRCYWRPPRRRLPNRGAPA